MFLYKKRDILAGIITLFILLLSSTSTSSAEESTQPVYSCPGELVDDINGALGDEFTQYTENTTGGRGYSRYFSFQTRVDGDVTLNINKNRTKQEIYIGTSCGGTQIHNGARNTTNYSGNFYVSAGTTYYVRIRERNRENRINSTITFDFIAPIVEPTPEPTPEPKPTPVTIIAINAAGSAYTSTDGTEYSADQYFNGGSTYSTSVAISGTKDDALYQTERYDNPTYAVPVENGNYEVTVKFTELYYNSSREADFDVVIEGVMAASNLDVWDKVGKNTVYDVTTTVTVSDGVLNISANNIKAIKISGDGTPPVDTTTPEPTPEPIVEPTPVDPSATAQLIYDDMYLDHEGYPHGVPSYYDFAQGPMIKDAAESVGDFQAMAGWGQVYEEINGNLSVNTRVELKNYRAYYLSKADNKWHELSVVENITEGAGYVEDYSDDNQRAAPADIMRFEPNGHVSTRPGSGYNFHFYTSRTPINPSDVAQIATSFDAKLIMADTNGIDDRSTAKFVAATGADVWRTMTATFSPDFSNNHDIGMGRFKYVTNEWRTFTFITDIPLAQLQENPPPLY